MESRYVSHYQNSVKNCSPRKISLKSGNQLPSYGQKTTFQTADVRHHEFLKCSYLVMWLTNSKCAVVYQISSKTDDFLLRSGDRWIFNKVCEIGLIDTANGGKGTNSLHLGTIPDLDQSWYPSDPDQNSRKRWFVRSWDVHVCVTVVDSLIFCCNRFAVLLECNSNEHRSKQRNTNTHTGWAKKTAHRTHGNNFVNS